MECTRCRQPLETSDNFCRRCGYPAGEVRLPAVRPEVYPSTRSQVLPLYLAVGTLGAALVAAAVRRVAADLVAEGAREVLRRLVRPRPSRVLEGPSRAEPAPRPGGFVYYRRLRIWRRY